jgi:DNA-binding response OmpR family regulator
MKAGENILVVESDPDIADVVCRQALGSLGYRPRLVPTAAAALEQARRSPPDLIISNLSLPDLSGKDLLAALSSLGGTAPLVVVAGKGEEQGVIQAFRLGAADALLWPARDCEVVQVIERALRQVRSARSQQKLDRDLAAAHEELQRRVLDQTTMLGFSRALLTVPDQRQFFSRLLEAALTLGQAQVAWLLVRDDSTGQFLLNAQRNLPAGWAGKLNQPFDDGLTQLVALSGQSLTIRGAPLGRFKVAALGKSAAVLPAKVRNRVVAILVVVRTADREFDANASLVLGALADFAAISLMNTMLFKALETSSNGNRAAGLDRAASVRSVVAAGTSQSAILAGGPPVVRTSTPPAGPAPEGLPLANLPHTWRPFRRSTEGGSQTAVPESA